MIFGSVSSAQAGSGVYPDSPIQITPLDYGGGNMSVEFKFASYVYTDGTFVGYPVAYHIEIYSGSTRIVNDDVWSPTIAYSPFSFGETYFWRVYAVYEFYDEYGVYAGMDIENSMTFS